MSDENKLMTQQAASRRSDMSEEEHEIVQAFILDNDFGKVPEDKRGWLYIEFCRYINVDPMERPFDIIWDRQGAKLYANSSCTNALCRAYGISRATKEVTYMKIGDTDYVQWVTVATMEEPVLDDQGRAILDTTGKPLMRTRSNDGAGVLPLVKPEMYYDNSTGKWRRKHGAFQPMTPPEVANAVMHAQTKAGRRAVLNLRGLGHVPDVGDAPPGSRHVEFDVSAGSITITDPIDDPDQIESFIADANRLVASLASARGVDESTVWAALCKRVEVSPGSTISEWPPHKRKEAYQHLEGWVRQIGEEGE